MVTLNYNFILAIQNEILRLLKTLISKKLIFLRKNNNEFEIVTKKHYLLAILNFFKNHHLFNFKQLIEISVIDRPDKINRFKTNYILSNIMFNTKIVVSVETKEVDMIPSTVNLYNSAEWLEREAWDLYGIHFDGNYDLRRIVTDYGFKGHPLRKDFPLTGFVEIYYNDEEKKIVYEPVELAQEYRVFLLGNPWSRALNESEY